MNVRGTWVPLSADAFREHLAIADLARERYLRALRTLTETSPAWRLVLDGAARVEVERERTGRLARLAGLAPHQDDAPGTRRKGRRPRSPRDRHHHNLNLSLLKLERAADAAVAVAVAAALASGPVESQVDDELAALAKALDELR